MRYKVTWLDKNGMPGGWESSHFETSEEWFIKESEELAKAMNDAAVITQEAGELVGGTELMNRVHATLLASEILEADEVESIFTFLHSAYLQGDENQVLLLYVFETGEADDLEGVWYAVDNNDFDEGPILFAVHADTMDEAIIKAVRHHYDNVLLDFVLNAIDWNSILDRIRGWPYAKYVIGSKCWAVYHKYNPND